MGFFRKLWDAHVQQYYPLSVTQLTSFEWYLLIWVLSIDEKKKTRSKSTSTASTTSNHRSYTSTSTPGDHIRRAIRLLPDDLRRHRRLESTVSKDRDRALILCTAHNGLNPFLIGDIMMMLDEEVVEHLFELDWYMRTARPEEKGYSSGVEDVVAELQRVRETWWPENLWPPGPTTVSSNNVSEEGSEIILCDACVLAKVVSTPTYLENLRVALLARHGHRKVRARKYNRRKPPPLTLLSFVDESIANHDDAGNILDRSETLADEMLSARLEARQAWKEWERRQKALGGPTGRPKRPPKRVRRHQPQRKEPKERKDPVGTSTRPADDLRRCVLHKGDYSTPAPHTRTSPPTKEVDKDHDSVVDEIDALYSSWKARMRPSLPCSSRYSRSSAFPDIPPTAPLSIHKEAPPAEDKPMSIPRKPLRYDFERDSVASERSVSPKTIRSSGRDKGKARVSVASEMDPDAFYAPPREGINWRRVVYERRESVGPSKAQAGEYTTVDSDVDSESEWEDMPVERGPGDTTWSLLMNSGM